ncbi:hypothetical protein Bca52824_027661 [Brassica carinata]|uniref:Uncharacterized protein n=1 Tax=Brassica carinata TaxID=52824 RepID=A0A8X8ANK1_BRACI|nr:hypothetical protein Bca52824_027661 [Brassica carinata]
MFKFTSSNNHIITECGVRILEEEVKKRIITEWPSCFETGDSTNYHTYDQNNDGDCEPKVVGKTYKAEDVEVSQVENLESTKHTGLWGLLRKLGLWKNKKMKKSETPF